MFSYCSLRFQCDILLKSRTSREHDSIFLSREHDSIFLRPRTRFDLPEAETETETETEADMDRAGEDGKVRFKYWIFQKSLFFAPKVWIFIIMATCYTFLESLGPGQCSRNICKIFLGLLEINKGVNMFKKLGS